MTRLAATWSSTRSTRAPSRTPTATAWATSPGSRRGWTTSRGWAPTRSGCRRSTRRRMADGGYDVADYKGVDPRFGTLADADALIAAAHELGMQGPARRRPVPHVDRAPVVPRAPRVVRLVARRRAAEQLARHVRRRRRGRATRTAAAGTCTRSIPSSPTSTGAIPTWPGGVRRRAALLAGRAGSTASALDALDRSLKDPRRCATTRRRRRAAAAARGTPSSHARARHSRNAPDVGDGAGRAARARAATRSWSARSTCPPRELGALPRAPRRLLLLRAVPLARGRRARCAPRSTAAAMRRARPAWVLSNHDFPRLPDRVGAAQRARRGAAAAHAPGHGVHLPGRRDRHGRRAGPDRRPGHDRAGRDAFRHPMQWDATPTGGFTTGTPWLPPIDPARRSVAGQAADRGSLLHLYRDLIALRRELGGAVRVARRRRRRARLPARRPPCRAEPRRRSSSRAARRCRLRHTHDPDLASAPGVLASGEGFLARRRGV